MIKIFIVLCAVLAVSCEKENIDSYLDAIHSQYAKILDQYDSQLNYFISNYESSIAAVTSIEKRVYDKITETNDYYAAYVLLNDLHKTCVSQYDTDFKSIESTKDLYLNCKLIATSQRGSLVQPIVDVINASHTYLYETFKDETNNCFNNISCIHNVANKANKFFVNNKKQFELAFDTAVCLSKTYVNNLALCTYPIEYNVFYMFGKVSTLIGQCVEGPQSQSLSQCIPCEKYSCDQAIEIVGDYNNTIVNNPLYGRSDNLKCLMLNIN